MSIFDSLNSIADRESLIHAIRELPEDSKIWVSALYEKDGATSLEFLNTDNVQIRDAVYIISRTEHRVNLHLDES